MGKDFKIALYGRFAAIDICPPNLLTKKEEDCFEKCESCEKETDIKSMFQDDDSNWFCPKCWNELEPVMKADFEELKRNGEIDAEETHK
ncbi:Uncharacterised protein [Chryseobacterium nakagawai]|uniref:Uncharacterized protein n=1 Tax=Chryseobacterium nakagawai TaxID=1241982 RepID=A0AAD0YMI0_CHRNA|nr:hypothetical protein [Chryseobacterium nakagawai]AZA91168.1 hypothetical protein EG343_11260 [Chryseobacterium nakagawai]VEH22730.1 Uncharacterised protein [Chryseobacterium nakagawai]